MKYGIGLETAADLKSSSGTEIWDKDENSSYNTGVTGIGRDDVSGLDQKSSQSENSSDILKIIELKK